jgi:hypothetical protein
MFTFQFTNPAMVGKETDALRFQLDLIYEGKVVYEIPGFRVKDGKLLSPANRVGKTYFPNFKWVDAEGLSFLTRLLIDTGWQSRFPQIQFPVGESNVVETNP